MNEITCFWLNKLQTSKSVKFPNPNNQQEHIKKDILQNVMSFQS